MQQTISKPILLDTTQLNMSTPISMYWNAISEKCAVAKVQVIEHKDLKKLADLADYNIECFVEGKSITVTATQL